MKNSRRSESALFTPRTLFALLLCCSGAMLTMLAFAGTPSGGSRTVQAATQTTGQSAAAADSTPAPTPPGIVTAPGVPRYYAYSPPKGVGEASGEPSIGFNPATGNAMFISNLQTLRVPLPNVSPLQGTACGADWLDVSFQTTKVKSLDPILFTDQGTHRTFVSQLNSTAVSTVALVPGNSLMAYSDDDGASWTPAQINPPDGSNDHQTVGAGPYPAALAALSNSVNKGHAVYYCGQFGTVSAGSTGFCSRSDDGGLNFGRATVVFQDAVNSCGFGIHGHVKVAPDGTVYLPHQTCGGGQAVFVSTNGGTTWTEHVIPGSRPMAPPIAPATFDSSDPSVGIASDDTVYFAWTGLVQGSSNTTDNHIFVAVSHNQGGGWTTPFDLGSSLGIKNAVFAAAVAGDPDRAAVAFLGTTEGGDHQSANFKGTWYGFVAHTYDGGQTWTTVNASGDPVQREACIWNSGGNNACRNLLDFNDATLDSKGRVLFAYADGCIDECAAGGSANSFSSKATIARQAGGKSLFKAFDGEFAEPVAPQRACLFGRRDDMASYLNWTPPDNGGSEITTYRIFRGTGGGPANQTFIGQTVGTDTTFVDRDVIPNVAAYTYMVTAVNAQGESLPSNIVELQVGPRLEPTFSCALPGKTAIIDPAGDPADAQPAHDITSVSMAEPDVPAQYAGKLVFTIKVANLSTIPPGWRWSVRFLVPGYLPPAATTGSEDWFVAMVSSDGATPSFDYGTTGVPPNATGRFFTTVGQLDPASNVQPDGTITLVMDKETFRSKARCSGTCQPLAPGQTINLTLGSVRASGPSAIPETGGTNETIPDVTGAGTYVLRSADLCKPNSAPVAVLEGEPEHGPAPLTVQFDATKSFDYDFIDKVTSYTFNFGDGGDDVTQDSATISHTYAQNGEYVARLVVTDSRGKVSGNTAQFVVEVNDFVEPSPTPTPGTTPTPTPKATPTITTQASAGTAVGSTISDTATLSGGSTPTGNVTFRLFGPDDVTCGAGAIFTSTVAVNGAGSYVSASFTPTAPGTYRWVASYSGDANNVSVNTACNDANESVSVSAQPTPTPSGTPTSKVRPSLSTQASPDVTLGASVSDTAILSGGNSPTGNVTFQLFGSNDVSCGSAAIFTSTVAVNGGGYYSSAAFTPSATGTYRWVATYSGDSANDAVSTHCGETGEVVTVSLKPSPTPVPSATPRPTPANVQLVNLSGRVAVQGGDKVGIGGFIVSGNSTKRVIVRGIGPSLKVGSQPVNGALQDPVVDLHNASGDVLSNDNWRSDQEAEIQDTGIAPKDDRESAIVKRLPAGEYTGVIRGSGDTTGIGLIEMYDADTSDPAELGNLSVRAQVGTDDDVLIAGVILNGGIAKQVVFRAIGPSLNVNGTPVDGRLQDPALEIYNENGSLIVGNDNWRDGAQPDRIEAEGLAPKDDHESAVQMTLQAGNYTAVVRGVNRTTGIGLAEVYKLP